jgi:hypothetical protein
MNVFDWLPRPGQHVEIPGGEMWCQEWEVHENRHGNEVRGRVVFEFIASKEAVAVKVDSDSLPPAPTLPSPDPERSRRRLN